MYIVDGPTRALSQKTRHLKIHEFPGRDAASSIVCWGIHIVVQSHGMGDIIPLEWLELLYFKSQESVYHFRVLLRGVQYAISALSGFAIFTWIFTSQAHQMQVVLYDKQGW